jgi:hypothetical protein
MSAFHAVADFLAANYRTGLEEALCDGCITGRPSAVLADVAQITPRLVRSTAEDDGGVAQTYDGVLAIAGVSYRFCCDIFIDRGGQRFLSDVRAFEPMERQAKGPAEILRFVEDGQRRCDRNSTSLR